MGTFSSQFNRPPSARATPARLLPAAKLSSSASETRTGLTVLPPRMVRQDAQAPAPPRAGAPPEGARAAAGRPPSAGVISPARVRSKRVSERADRPQAGRRRTHEVRHRVAQV